MGSNNESAVREPLLVKRTRAAELLDCSTGTIRNLCIEGRLETVLVGKKDRGDKRITMKSIRRFAGEKD